MKRNPKPIAFAYDADHHCPGCAEERFGRCPEHGDIACCVEDSEGNTPGAVFAWDETPETGIVCRDCWDVIREGVAE